MLRPRSLELNRSTSNCRRGRWQGFAWICFMATGGTPAPIIARLDEEMRKALALPEVREAFAKQGVEVMHMGPQELGKFLKSEAIRYGHVLKHSRAMAQSNSVAK